MEVKRTFVPAKPGNRLKNVDRSGTKEDESEQVAGKMEDDDEDDAYEVMDETKINQEGMYVVF